MKENIISVQSPKDKKTALLLCLFLGWLGIHRFYVGKIKAGFWYMFTFGFLGMGWALDLILILTNSFTDVGGHFLK